MNDRKDSDVSPIKNFARVLGYAGPYKGKIAAVLVCMVLFSVAALAPIALIRPLVGYLSPASSGETSQIPGDAFVVVLEDGSEVLLSDALVEVEGIAEDSWKNSVPGFVTVRDWIDGRPTLKALLLGDQSEAPPVQIASRTERYSPETLNVFVRPTVWGRGEWRSLAETDLDLTSPIASIEKRPQPVSAPPLLLYALLVPILFLIKGALGVTRQILLASVALGVVRDIQNHLYDRLLAQPVGFFQKARTGDLMSRLINDVMILSRQIVTVLTDLVQSPILALGTILFCFWIDWKVALVFFLVVPALAVPMQVMSKRIRRASRKAQEKRADISSVLVETLTGVEVVKAFNMEEYERERYALETKSLLRREMRIRKNRAFSSPTTELAASFGIAAVIMIALWRQSQDPTFGIGELGQIAAAFTFLIKPIDRFWKAAFLLGEMAESGRRIFSLIDREPEIVERPDALDLSKNWSEIRFDHVTFAYDEDEPVLKDIDFTMRRGEKIAIVGKTGSGKTTLVNLLARFYDTTEGRVMIDDVDLRDLKMSSLLEQIGIVTQRNILFNDTVANNIAYGRPDISREQIRDAAAAAYADEFIAEMPETYDTVIGEMGTRLSGGQAQRLSIARAVLKNPPILILDEATASLDTASEKLVQEALDNLMENRTTFAIAHRLSTILNADRILVLHEGTLIESGTHDELYGKGGAYTRLYDAQFVGNDEASE